MSAERIKSWADLEMAEFDRLPPAMRAAVREYNELPWHPRQPLAEYIESQKEFAQASQDFYYPGLTDYLEPVT